MKRLKIALFIDTYFPMVDGVIIVVDNYAKRLSEYADVTVFCPKPKEKKYDDTAYNYAVKRCRSLKIYHYDYPLGLPIFDRKFRKALYLEDFDIVHVHSPFFVSRLGVKYAKKKNIPVIATMHSQYKQDFRTATKSRFLSSILLKFAMIPFNKCDECWAVNSAIKDLYVDEYGVKSPCIVQTNATDMYLKDKNDAFKTIKDTYDIDENERVLLFSGRLIEQKNIFFIVEALKELKAMGEKFRMVFLGTGPDEKKLKAMISEYGLDGDTIFTGKITDRDMLAYFYRRADLFLFPSLYDANSLVQIEAASQRTPTIFMRGSKTSSTAVEDVSCIMSENNAVDFAKKVKRALNDDEYLEKISEGAYKHLYATWDETVDKVYKRYVELIEEKKPKGK